MQTQNIGTRLQIRRQTWITRDDLRANRDLIYVFGDNVERDGRRGLAREMRGEPNAHSISVSWGPFEPFTIDSAAAAKSHIDDDLRALVEREAAWIIWPMAGIVPEFLTIPDDIYQHLQRQTRHLLNARHPV